MYHSFCDHLSSFRSYFCFLGFIIRCLVRNPKSVFLVRKKLTEHIFRQIVLTEHILCDLAKTIVICTPKRESARENNLKATNSDIGTHVFVFVEIFGV